MHESQNWLSAIKLFDSVSVAVATLCFSYSNMDYIRKFDVQLERECVYPGQMLCGVVIMDNCENMKIRNIRANLRGKAHVEWKVMKSGERRTVKDDQYFLDEKVIVWGKGKEVLI